MTAAEKKNSSTKANFALLFCFDLLRLHSAIFLPCNAAPSLPPSLAPCVAHGQQNLAIKDESIVHIDDNIAMMDEIIIAHMDENCSDRGPIESLQLWMKVLLTWTITLL